MNGKYKDILYTALDKLSKNLPDIQAHVKDGYERKLS